MQTLANTSAEVSLTAATVEDLDYLTDKTLDLHHFESNNQPAQLKVNSQFDSHIRQWLELELSNPGSLIFLLHLKDKKVGFAFLQIISNPNQFTNYVKHGVLQSIWIDKPYRKLALGQKTVSFIESIFSEEGIEYYEVNYTSTNQVARDFWNSCGLKETSVTARKFL